MEKIKNIDKQREFIKLYLSGKYQQKAIAKEVGVSEKTATQWIRQIQPLRYYRIRADLTKRLEELTKQSDYANNAAVITGLITDIERIEKLIIKSKYIPHITNF